MEQAGSQHRLLGRPRLLKIPITDTRAELSSIDPRGWRAKG